MRSGYFWFYGILLSACPPPFLFLAQFGTSMGEEGALRRSEPRKWQLEEEPRSRPKQAPRPKKNHGWSHRVRSSGRPAVLLAGAEERRNYPEIPRRSWREVADQKKQLEARQKQLDSSFKDIRTDGALSKTCGVS